jgi:L-fuconolactonase
MFRIDSHQHFWKFDPVRDRWIDDTMAVIQRDFLPEDLKPVLDENGIDGCVAVQADQSEAENDFLLECAESNDFVKGVLGWVNLRSPELEERLEYYSSIKKMKGFRHVLQGETERDLMLFPDFMDGIQALNKYNFTYDVLIFPDQLKFIPAFVKAFPDQKFVIDHIAKPYIKDKRVEKWANEMSMLAGFENVYCKVSGMVTEAKWLDWETEDFTPYLDVVFETFGSKRVMFGSDWPVCNVAGGYAKVVSIAQSYTTQLSADEQADFWGNNAVRFYGLD